MLKKNEGVTLIELMVAMALTMLIATAIYNVYGSSAKNMQMSFVRNRDREIVSNASHVIQRDLRGITVSTNFESVALADDKNITFYTDSDSDDLPEKISYTLANSTLTRRLYQPDNDVSPYTYNSEPAMSVLADDVTNTGAFSYYSDFSTTMTSLPLSSADRQKIRIVEILLAVDSNGSEPPPPSDVLFNVNLRNTND